MIPSSIPSALLRFSKLKTKKIFYPKSVLKETSGGNRILPDTFKTNGGGNVITLLSLFSGIGAFEKALTNLKIPYDVVSFCEFDRYAVKSYCAIHGVSESINLGDITKVDESILPKGIDLLTYGFPCQDISTSGMMKGLFNADGTYTRSGLFFEALRIIKATKPKILIAENVKNLISKKFFAQFDIVLKSLQEVGYNNYWAVLNAKDYGVSQNRKRVFIVSIRKDSDHKIFEFPKAFPLEKRLKDFLEDSVDEKYYLSEKGLLGLANALFDGRRHKPSFYTGDEDAVCTIDTRVGAHAHYAPYVLVREATKQGYAKAYPWDSINLEHPNSKTRRGQVGKQIAQTLTTSCNQAVFDGCRVRRFTPKECFRLMGFDDESFFRAKAVNSDTQLYKQAGNSIVVDVLEELFCMMFDEDGKIFV